MDGRCETCRYWNAPVSAPHHYQREMFVIDKPSEDDDGYRSCARTYRFEWAIPEEGVGDDETLAYVGANTGDDYYILWTAPNFGCVQYEAKENA